MSLIRGRLDPALSFKSVKNMVENGRINLNHPTQRGEVWDISKKSYFIDSIIRGYPVFPIVFKRKKSEDYSIYHILDGVNRLTTVKKFINNEFSLKGVEPVEFYDITTGEKTLEKLNGKYFNELSDAIRTHIEISVFEGIYYDDPSEQEEREIVKRLNAGVHFKTKNLIVANCNDIDNVLYIGSHELFEKIYPPKRHQQKEYVVLIIKMWMLLSLPTEIIDFSNKKIMVVEENMIISLEEKEIFKNILDYINVCYDLVDDLYLKTKIFKEDNILSYFLIVKDIYNNINPEEFAKWLISFYSSKLGEESISEEYNDNIKSFLKNKNVNLINRINIIKINFQNQTGKIWNK